MLMDLRYANSISAGFLEKRRTSVTIGAWATTGDVDEPPVDAMRSYWSAPPRLWDMEMAILGHHSDLRFRSAQTSYMSIRNLLKLTPSL